MPLNPINQLTFNKMFREIARMGTTQENCVQFPQILEVAPHETAAVWPLTSHLTCITT